MNNLWYCVKSLVIAMGGAIVLSTNSAIAQIDHNDNQPNSYGITTQDNTAQGNIEITQVSSQYEANLPQSFNALCIPCPSTGSPLGCNC